MDSAQKIANCIRASARDVGVAEPSVERAKSIIGLGLFEAMQTLFPDLDTNQVQSLVDRYKYHFVRGDVTEQQLFDGVEEGLRALENSGAMLAVATGKSRAGLDRAFASNGLEKHFTVTRCADETRSKPHPQMLNEILDFTAIDSSKTIMVGDTTFDMDMALNANIAGLGAGYGVHSEQMLMASKAVAVHQNFGEMMQWFLDGRVERAHG